MFDSIVNGHRHATRRDVAPLLISSALHTVLIGAVVLLPLLFARTHAPPVPAQVLSYVTVTAPPPPPPPPPPASASTPTPVVKRPSPRSIPTPRPALQVPVAVAR